MQNYTTEGLTLLISQADLKIQSVDENLKKVEDRLDARFDNLNAKFDENNDRLMQMIANLTTRTAAQDTEIAVLREKTEAHVKAITQLTVLIEKQVDDTHQIKTKQQSTADAWKKIAFVVSLVGGLVAILTAVL